MVEQGAMSKDDQNEESTGHFVLSRAPVVSSATVDPSEEGGRPSGSNVVSFLAGWARNPREALFCWQVDWAAAFEAEAPSERRAHLRLEGKSGTRMQEIEPMRGWIVISELDAGEAYYSAIGYFAQDGTWRAIVHGDELRMPLETVTESEIEYASIPWHLTFERMMSALPVSLPLEEAVRALGRLQNRAQQDQPLTRRERSVQEVWPFAASKKVAAALAHAPALRSRNSFAGASPEIWGS